MLPFYLYLATGSSVLICLPSTNNLYISYFWLKVRNILVVACKKQCTFSGQCNTTSTVRIFIAYKSSWPLECDTTFTPTKMQLQKFKNSPLSNFSEPQLIFKHVQSIFADSIGSSLYRFLFDSQRLKMLFLSCCIYGKLCFTYLGKDDAYVPQKRQWIQLHHHRKLMGLPIYPLNWQLS